MPNVARSHGTRKPTAAAVSRAPAHRAAQVDVPPGLSAEEARRVLAAVASSAGAVARTGRTLTLDIEPAARKGASRFRIVKLLRPEPATQPSALPAAEISPDDAQAALRLAYARGADAAAELLSGPDMLSSDTIAERLGLSREAVHQKRRRGELLGVEGAKRGVRFPAWQLGSDGLPLRSMKDLHAALGEPWAVFRFLRQRHPELGMRTGLEAVADPRRTAEAVTLARGVGTFGPAGS